MMSAVRRGQPAAQRPSAAQVDAVLRASRALVGIAAESIAEVVADLITMPQLRVLVMIDTRGPMNLAAVAAGLGVNPSNASRLCDRLIKAGLLDRRESQADRRNVTLTLKPAGRRLMDEVIKHRRDAIERILREIPAADRDRLTIALNTFATAAGGPPEDDTLGAIWPGAR